MAPDSETAAFLRHAWIEVERHHTVARYSGNLGRNEHSKCRNSRALGKLSRQDKHLEETSDLQQGCLY